MITDTAEARRRKMDQALEEFQARSLAELE